MLPQTNGNFVPRHSGSCQRFKNCEPLAFHAHVTQQRSANCQCSQQHALFGVHAAVACAHLRAKFDVWQVIVADAKHAFVEHVEEEVKEKKKDRDTYEVSCGDDLAASAFSRLTAQHIRLLLFFALLLVLTSTVQVYIEETENSVLEDDLEKEVPLLLASSPSPLLLLVLLPQHLYFLSDFERDLSALRSPKEALPSLSRRSSRGRRLSSSGFRCSTPCLMLFLVM
jgi:hypothetical protein